jgi:hypothetical protein
MNIYSINLTHNPFEPAGIQFVDLDRIVSITPISVCNYTGYNIGDTLFWSGLIPGHV